MIGRTISHYKILEKLGEGGMGVVYKAEDTKLRRSVALKFLSPQSLIAKEQRTRLIREAQAAAILDHPNICTVYGVEEADGHTFISMAYIEGVALTGRILSGPLELNDVREIAVGVARGLGAAHEKGIVHRDLKSANIMVVPNGQAKIMDFGLAKLQGATKVTKTGKMVGTVSYMSPEQARGEGVDHRTDLWSLGVVVFEMLTGQMPFEGHYEQAVIYQILNEDPKPVAALRTGVPVGLAKIVSKCLEKDQSDRYQHSDHLVADLLKVRNVLPTVNTTETTSSSPNHGSQDSIPGYKIVRKLSEGGQGVVYQAIQESTRRKVAIKMMREGAFASRSAMARFDREVQILARLHHPNIVSILDSGTAVGCNYLVMDYIAGQPLDEYLQSAGAPEAIKETMRLFEKICSAVNAAHLAGIIHRDLKPSNIRIDSAGEPHILDFGIAKVPLSDSDVSMMTMTGQFIGSLPWASPEQAVGMPDKIDMRTDVYSLGVVAYQMLTGEFPYDVTGNMRDVLDRIMRTEPRGASTLRREINDEVNTIVLKCLSKNRERRYQSAGELARDVRHYLSGQPIEAKRDSFGYLMRKQLMRHKVPVAVSVGFVAVILVGLVTSLTLWRRAESEGANARFHLEAARTEVIESFEEYQAMIPQLRRAEDLAALLPKEVHRQFPQDSPAMTYLEATEWITGLFPSTPDSILVTGHAALNTQTRDAVILCAKHPDRPRDPVAVAWVRANRDGVKNLVEATKQHRFDLGPSTGGGLLLGYLLPSLRNVRFGAEVLTLSAVVHHDDGNSEMAIENLDAAMRISRYAGDGATLISTLVEIACRNVIHNAYRWMVIDAVEGGSLPPAYTAFLRQAPPLPDYKHAYISDVRAFRQILNETFVRTNDRTPARLDLARLRDLADEWTDEWGGEGNPYTEPSEAMNADADALDYDQAISIITELYDRLRVQQDVTFREIRAEGDRVEKRLQDDHPALNPLMPNLTRAIELRREAQMNRDATVIAVAIGVFRHSNGGWPESIHDALASFELEPYYRNYYGHDFIYKIVDAAPLLYVVGPNGVDEGGRGRRFEDKGEPSDTGDDVLFLAPPGWPVPPKTPSGP